MLVSILSFQKVILRSAILLTVFHSHAELGFSNPALPSCLIADESSCQIALNQLRPTQLTYGQIEVERRQVKFEAMSPSEKEKFIEEHVIPIVKGPGNKLYMLDHHHFGEIRLPQRKGHCCVNANW